MLYLDFHHHTILVSCNESRLLQKLAQEFFFFETSGSVRPQTTIELILDAPPQIPFLVASKLLENAVVYRMGPRQYVDYFGEALTIWDKPSKKIQIFSQNEDRLYELGFLTIHSMLGQELDKVGMCRLHAMAISLHKINAIVMLPSKGGKSTLLTNVLKNPDVKIISDDMPLCDREGKIFSFPSKMGLNERPTEGPLSGLNWQQFMRSHYPPKWTASLSQMKDRINTNPQENQNLLISGFRLSNGQSILSEVPKWKMFMPMMEHMIMGFGLPQILEMFLNFNLTDFIKLPYHAAIRSICAFNLVRNARCYYFYMGPDKTLNSQLLLDLAYEHQNY